jgi:alpha-1,3-glucosyltransferase
MALTRRLPIEDWYRDTSSQWTLDYPPFFAWFEYGLGWLAEKLSGDPNVTQIYSDGYSSAQAIIFMRFSVIASELLLVFACWR